MMLTKEILLQMPELRDRYAAGENIMEHFRAASGSQTNSLEAILVSYDLQTGSYIEARKDPELRKYKDLYCEKLAVELDKLQPQAILEAGVGEGTTLVSVAKALSTDHTSLAGFDISLSRAFCAREYCTTNEMQGARIFAGDLFAIPLCDNSYDVVFTSHTVSPNLGKEREALEELYRITANYLLLLEPSYELGDKASRENMDTHRYCRGLRSVAKELGYDMQDYRLFDNSWPASDTELLLIRKNHRKGTEGFACPISRTPLTPHNDQLFCESCSLVFPIIGGIPQLLPDSGIFCTKFLDY